jgi:Ca2+-binding EF-hand superfamily protein
VTDLITVGFAADTSGLDKGAQDVERFGQKIKTAVEPTGALESAARRLGISVEEMRQKVANAPENVRKYEAGLDTARKATDQLSASTKAAAKDLQNAGGAIQGAGEALKNHANVVDNAGKAHQRGALNVAEFRAALRVMGREAALIGGPLGEVIRTVSTLSMGLVRLHPIVLLVTIAIAALTAGLLLSIKAWAAFEEQQAKVQNALAATHGASLQTTQSLNVMARQLASTGTQSIDVIREAQLELLKTKEVSGDTFGFILSKAKDVAATGFADFKTAVKAMAAAFKDPTEATDKLAEVGLKLSVREQRLATDLFNTGRLLEARRVIQDALSKQMVGADTNAADTLGAAWSRLTRSGGLVLEAWGKQISEALNLKNVLGQVADAAQNVAEKAKNPSFLEAVTGAGTGGGFMGVVTAPFRYGMRAGGSLMGGNNRPMTDRSATDRNAAFPRFDDSITQIGITNSAAEQKRREEALKTAQAEQELKKRIDATVDSLEVEGRTSGLNATQQRVYNEQLKAGVLQTDEFGNVSISSAEKAKAITKAVVNNESLRFIAQLTAGFITQSSAIDAETATVGQGVQAMTAYRYQQEKAAQAKAQGLPVSAALQKEIDKEAASIGKANEALERRKVLSEVEFQSKTMFLTDRDVEIATKLRGLYGNDVPRALASSEAAALKASIAMKGMVSVAKTATEQFTTEVVTGFLDGKSAIDSMHDAFNSLSKSMASAAIKDLISGQWEKAGLEAVIAIGAKLASNFFNNEDEKKLDAARKAWADMRDTVADFMSKAAGGSGNNLSSTFRSIAKDFITLAKAANEAKDFAALAQLVQATVAQFDRMQKDFVNSFQGTLAAMADGSGPDGPFAQGQKRIQDLTTQIKDFVQDTTSVFSGAIASAWKLGFVPTQGTTDASRQIAMAQAAGRAMLLTQISGVQTLSAVASKLAEMNGKTVGLQQALIDLGLSADEATNAINNARTQGIARIAADFVDGLNRQLNEATGHGFINQITDLIRQTEQSRADAALLPGAQDSLALIDRLFAAQAQQIVDQAGLVGDAFNDLIRQFPNLTGLIHESTTALEQQAQAQRQLKDQLNDAAKEILNYINSVNVGTDSSLSPTARLEAAQQTYNAKLVLAAANNQDALKSITGDAENLRRALRDVYGSTSNFTNAWNTIQQQLLSLPAVVNSDDPMVIILRDVLKAQQDVVFNTGAQGVLKAAIDSGSAAAVATALQTYFDTLDTNIDGVIDLNEMKTALGSMVDDTRLKDMFTRLDTDNSGGISKLELIQSATDATSVNTNLTAARTDAVDTNVFLSKLALNSIEDLQATSTATLGVLKDAFVASPLGGLVGQPNPPTTNSDPVITALRKIVYNTGVIATNTYTISGGTPQVRGFGVFAQGGLITGGVQGRDSVPIMAMPGEYVLQASATRALVSKFGSGVLDVLNSGMPITMPVPTSYPMGGDDVVEAIEGLGARMGDIERAVYDLRGDVRAGAEHVREGVDAVKSSHDDVRRELALPKNF